jgi:hypothetical protein
MHGSLLLQLLDLLVVANGTAVVAKKLLGDAFARRSTAALSLSMRNPYSGPLKLSCGGSQPP